MTWVKEANKIGRYCRSYRGFRGYEVIPRKVVESIVQRNGEHYRRTEFQDGLYVWVNKKGARFEGIAEYSDRVAFAIDVYWLENG